MIGVINSNYFPILDVDSFFLYSIYIFPIISILYIIYINIYKKGYIFKKFVLIILPSFILSEVIIAFESAHIETHSKYCLSITGTLCAHIGEMEMIFTFLLFILLLIIASIIKLSFIFTRNRK